MISSHLSGGEAAIRNAEPTGRSGANPSTVRSLRARLWHARLPEGEFAAQRIWRLCRIFGMVRLFAETGNNGSHD